MFLDSKHSLSPNLLSVTSAKFIQVACEITDKVAKLLYTKVFIINHYGIVITSSEPTQVGLPFQQISKGAIKYLRVPLEIDNQVGEVIVGEPLNGEVISPRLSQVLVELVVNQTTVTERLPKQQEPKNQFISDLLHGQIVDEALMLHQAKLLGMDLTPPRAVILIDAAEYVLMPNNNEYIAAEVRKHQRAQLIISSVVSFFHLPDDTICTDMGEGEVAVLKASDSKNLGSWADNGVASETSSSSWANLTALKRAGDALLLRLRSDTGTAISVGIGRYHPGIRGLARSYQDARAALSLGRRFDGHNRVHCLDRLGIAAFACVADERTKVDLATYLLSPLDHDPELLTTLETFFAQNCCPSSTAKLLSIHRNTLSYRLNKIASLTGLDPRQFDDAVQMRLALLLRKL